MSIDRITESRAHNFKASLCFPYAQTKAAPNSRPQLMFSLCPDKGRP
jgi:hypothetical protein